MADNISPEVVKELAPTGKLRAAINFGNPVLAQKDHATGVEGGVTVELARALGRRLDVPVELVPFDAAGKVFEALEHNAWDLAFLAIEPVRAAQIDFTPPYVEIEGGYVVSTDSPLRLVDEVDRDGLRVAVGKGSAYDLYLSRTLKHAQLFRAPTSQAAVDEFVAHRAEVLAGVKQPLAAFVGAHPDVRMIPGRFMVIRQAMGVPKGKENAARYLRGFIEEMKSSGFVAAALRRSGQADAAVAPPADGK